MDGDHSPARSEASADNADPPGQRPAPAAPTPPSDNPGLLRRLFGWRSNGGLPVDPAEDQGALGQAFQDSSPAELAMVTNILRLRDLRVMDVMTPRADVVAVAEDATPEEMISIARQGSHSRLPVFRETLDDPIGFVHIKDLALHYGFDGNGGRENFRLADHIRTALFVPPSMRIAALLQKMQGDRVHMALVIDEFGGVDGLVTIEDLVEQIVGDIEDEHDLADSKEWSRSEDGSWLIQARADIRDFEEAEGIALLPEDWDEEVDTMGGFVFTLANRVPTRGEVIVHPLGYEFEIVDADPRRIKRLKLRLSGRTAPSAQAAE